MNIHTTVNAHLISLQFQDFLHNNISTNPKNILKMIADFPLILQMSMSILDNKFLMLLVLISIYFLVVILDYMQINHWLMLILLHKNKHYDQYH